MSLDAPKNAVSSIKVRSGELAWAIFRRLEWQLGAESDVAFPVALGR